MTNGKWNFRVGPNGLELDAPADIDEPAQIAIWDFATSDIGNSTWMWKEYRKTWEALSHDPVAAHDGISGNSTSQHIEGDDVVFEALYNQWPTVRITRTQFEAFLDQFGEFLRNSGSDA